MEPVYKARSDLKFVFELCLRSDPETLILNIYDNKDPGPGGNPLKPIKSVKDFLLTGFEVSWSTLALELTSVYNKMYPT